MGNESVSNNKCGNQVCASMKAIQKENFGISVNKKQTLS